MGNRTGLQLNSKQSLLSQLAMLIRICNCWIEDKKPALYYRLLSLCDFICANLLIMLILDSLFQSREFHAPVAIGAALAITTSTTACMQILKSDGSSTPGMIARIGMFLFPFMLPAIIKFSVSFALLSYLLIAASFIVLVGESIIARRSPLPRTVQPALIAIFYLVLMIVIPEMSLELNVILAIMVFYAAFIAVVYSLISAAKVLQPVRVEG
jgi:hypothetical protein